jgi:hypothetical protein
VATVACIQPPPIPPTNSVNLPGMGELTFIRDSLTDLPRPSTLILRALNSVSPATAPFYTILRVLDVIQAIINCQKAIKDAVTQLNPGPIFGCFEKLFKAFAALLPLFPPISYVRMVVDIIVLLRLLLDDIISVFGLLDQKVTQAKAIIQRGYDTGDANLVQIGNCSMEDLNAQTAGIMQIFEVIGKLLSVFISLLELMAEVLPEPAKKKIEDTKKMVTDFQDQVGDLDPGAVPPLGQLVALLTELRNILVYIEAVGRAICGLPGSFSQLQQLVLENP